jgi:FtsP/CotA-like multicopper oxidase with cupredoxin domain
MRNASLAALALLIAAPSAGTHAARRAAVVPNPNTVAAGTLRNGVLSLDLDATTGAWPAEASKDPFAGVAVFAERGKPASAPGPLIRVPAGTLVRVNLRNTLARPLTFYLPITPSTWDSVKVAPNGTGTLAVRAAKPGNFIYRAITDSKVSLRIGLEGTLAGAMVVDTAGLSHPPRDRVMVLMQVPDSTIAADLESGKTLAQMQGWYTFTINGRAWPNTERITATVGDTLRWRVINASFDTHPMHLHGVYYHVDEFTGLNAERNGQSAAPGTVITQAMTIFSAMSMTWVPERVGNWPFHCHFALHIAPDAQATKVGERGAQPEMAGHENHAMTGMVGLIIGITVTPKKGTVAAREAAPARKLRLLAVSDSGFPATRPSLHFVIEEKGRRTEAWPGLSPTLYLRRNELVSITVVNTLHEKTAVHWHGMELDSYYDGVPGLSGAGTRVAPIIAPGDSFEVRFAPPRSGTFMYHSHMDEIRQQPAGMVGAMIVRDGPEAAMPDDHEFFFKGARSGPIGNEPVEISGQSNPDTLVVRAGRPVRLRFMSLAAISPTPTVTITTRADSTRTLLSDSLIVRWTPIAKDGADLPAGAPPRRPAKQLISIGETYDFEFLPERKGQLLRIEVRTSAGVLSARVPVRVE